MHNESEEEEQPISDEENQRIADVLERDYPRLWEHALEELVVALLRKIVSSPQTQGRILATHQTYTNATLKRAYTWWRKENPSADIKFFLAKAPTFILPSLSGGKRQQEPSLPLFEARHDYNLILQRMQAGNRLKSVSRYKKLQHRKEEIQKILDEVFYPQKFSEKQKKELKEKLDDWQREPRGVIAIEAAAWRHELEPSYVERYKGKAIEKHISSTISQRHTAETKVAFQSKMLARQTDSQKLKTPLYSPGEEKLYNKQLDLQKRVNRSKN